MPDKRWHRVRDQRLAAPGWTPQPSRVPVDHDERAQFVDTSRAAGIAWKLIAWDLGIHPVSLHRWCLRRKYPCPPLSKW